MARRQRRQSQNSRYMRQILDRLREYDVDEVRLLCERYCQRHSIHPGESASARRAGRRRRA